MERPSHSSTYVAPLYIARSTPRVSTDDHPQSITTTQAIKSPYEGAQLTPPLTPHSSEEIMDSPIEPKNSLFHNYLRAYYPYHPTRDETSSTVTLPLNRGDIVLIHSIHTNGWADGTLLTSGARGWLPTNYCEAYDSDLIRNLMKALTNFWDLIRGCAEGGFEVIANQDYMRGFVAGVRLLLVSGDTDRN